MLWILGRLVNLYREVSQDSPQGTHMVILSYNPCHRVITQIAAGEVGTVTSTRSVVLTVSYESYVG